MLPLKILHLQNGSRNGQYARDILAGGQATKPQPPFLKILDPPSRMYNELNQLFIILLNNCFPFHIDIWGGGTWSQ